MANECRNPNASKRGRKEKGSEKGSVLNIDTQRGGRAQFEVRMEQRRAAVDGRAYPAIQRGWCLGGEQFRVELLERKVERLGNRTPRSNGRRAGRSRRSGSRRRNCTG